MNLGRREDVGLTGRVPQNEEVIDVAEPAFPPQQQTLPGFTTAMTPQPDHGESSYVGSGKLAGRRTLITGGDSGIGRAVAIAYAREGADVAFTHLPVEHEDAAETVRLVEAEGRRCVPIAADFTSSSVCDDVVARTVADLGGLDVLVNNAGYQYARQFGLENMDDERIERTITTNLTALIWMTRAALPHLERGDSIINNSSIQAFTPSATLLDYAATKAAVNNFTVNLAADLGPRGIRVNAVVPGPVWTPLQPATQPTEKIEQFGVSTPLGRAAQPAELAPAFVFLANERDASYISGTVLGVTGGKPVF